MKNSGASFFLFLFGLLMSFGLIVLGGSLGKSKFFEPIPSQPVIDKTAQEKSDTELKILKEKSDAEIEIMKANATAERIAIYAVAGSIIIVLVIPSGVWVGISAVSAWNRRHDRLPNKHGNYPAVKDDSSLVMLGTGLSTSNPPGEETIKKLSGDRAMVDATRSMFAKAAPDNKQRARRERMIEDDYYPPGWDEPPPMAEIQPPEQNVNAFLVDGQGNRSSISPDMDLTHLLTQNNGNN